MKYHKGKFIIGMITAGVIGIGLSVPTTAGALSVRNASDQAQGTSAGSLQLGAMAGGSLQGGGSWMALGKGGDAMSGASSSGAVSTTARGQASGELQVHSTADSNSGNQTATITADGQVSGSGSASSQSQGSTTASNHAMSQSQVAGDGSADLQGGLHLNLGLSGSSSDGIRNSSLLGL